MLAKQLDSTIKSYRISVSSTKRERAMKQLGWSLAKFNQQLTYRRKWNRVCSEYDGLLCFIVPLNEGGADLASY